MSGAAIIAEMLYEDASLTAVVPVDRIKGGRLPDGTALPALLIRTVSASDRQRMRPGTTRRTVERVSVAVRATSYREQRTIIGLIRACCADRTGDFAGCFRASVLTAGVGPDVVGPGDSFEQTQDFRVSFDAMT